MKQWKNGLQCWSYSFIGFHSPDWPLFARNSYWARSHVNFSLENFKFNLQRCHGMLLWIRILPFDNVVIVVFRCFKIWNALAPWTSLWKILNLIYRDAMECFCGLGSFHLIMLSLWFFIVLKYEMPLHHEHHTMFLTVACPNKWQSCIVVGIWW